MSETGVFVTGTDTGVGKTFIATLLASSLVKRGVDVGVMKPVETGSTEIIPSDAKYLINAAETEDPPELVCPLVYRDPLSPMNAAEREGLEVDLDKIRSAYRELTERHKLLLVEGAGGLLVPLNQRYYIIDMVVEMGLPLIIVAHDKLGCINQILLTLNAAKDRNIDVLAIVLNRMDMRGDLSTRGNSETIKKLTGRNPVTVGYTPVKGKLYKHPDADSLVTRVLAALPAV